MIKLRYRPGCVLKTGRATPWRVAALPEKAGAGVVSRSAGMTLVCTALLLLTADGTAVSATDDGAGAPRVLAEWKFTEDGNRLGWTPNGHIEHPEVVDGAFCGKAVGSDPILLSPVFEVGAGTNQVVEVVLRSAEGGQGQLFWTHTLQGRYGGFSGRRSLEFACRGGKQSQLVRLLPFWHTVGKIIRLRVDPPSASRFAIEAIRVLELPDPPPSDATLWSFAHSTHHWRTWRDATEPQPTADGLEIVARGPSPLLVSPPLRVPAEGNYVVSVRMATDAGRFGRILAVSDAHFGSSAATFELKADGRMQSYHVDVAEMPCWEGKIIRLALQPTNQRKARAVIGSIEIAAEPSGPPELAVGYFGQAEGVNRVGRPAGIVCALRNVGAAPAKHVRARLRLVSGAAAGTSPSGARIVGPVEHSIDSLRRDLPEQLHWQVATERPGAVEVAIEVTADGLPPLRRTARLRLTPVPEVAVGDYIPEPRPVASDYEIGTFYFPGWPTMNRWQPIFDFPERKPVLGWYDESNPEVVDWQIKWAVEHGIAFFMVDWYWCRGHRHLEHWLHEGYMNARFRRYLKWAVMWANHHPVGSHSASDWREVTQYWIDHYFGMDEYYRIDGKPAVFIWAPENIRSDVGGSRQAAELYAMSQAMARKAGYPGIFFVAMHGHHSGAAAAELRAEGYQGVTSYHAFQRAMRQAEGRRFPFEAVVETSPEVWRRQDERAGRMLSIPLVDTGWSSEPWHGREARVIYGRTPEWFGQLCRRARRYADATGKRIIAVGPWNEWGEGSYIEPYAEHGFAHLDELRAAFCQPGDWPPNLVPADVGRGPYGLPPVPERTAWYFDDDGDFEGWSANAYVNARVAGGLLHGASEGTDPVLHGPAVRFAADRFRAAVIRMKSDGATRGQLFWGTTVARPSEAASVRFDVVGDGRFREYRLDLAAQRTWRGVITSLRFDPAGRSDVEFAVDEIRLE